MVIVRGDAIGCSKPGRSMQAGAPLAPGISQQAFKHAAGIRVVGVISARVTPISKIPTTARASATRSAILIDCRGGHPRQARAASTRVLDFVILSPRLSAISLIKLLPDWTLL